jgi:DUF4097 and DUF4098 domain-containing protein YvlB
MERSFETHEPVSLYAELGKGHLTITAEDTTETTVKVTGTHAEEVLVDQSGTQISVVAPRQRMGFFGGSEPSLDIEVTVPTGSDLITKTGSADQTATGSFGLAKVKSGSGDIRFGSFAGHVAIDTGSGDIVIGAVGADLRIKSGSGDVEVGDVTGTVGISTGSGDIKVGTTKSAAMIKSGSGDLSIQTADSDVSLSSASGDLTVAAMNRGSLTAKNASGDIRVGIPAGTPVWTDVSSMTGRIGSDLEGAGQPEPGQDYVEVRAKTLSGDIVLKQL